MDEEKDTLSVNLGGRPPYEPDDKTRAVVESAVAFGVTQVDIATHIGIDAKTLRKHFQKELNEGAFKAHMKVGGIIYELATRSVDENVRFRAAAFYAARRMGWKETTTQENVGKDGGPMQTVGINTNDPIEAAKVYQRLIGEK